MAGAQLEMEGELIGNRGGAWQVERGGGGNDTMWGHRQRWRGGAHRELEME
jgi:hypothetical protein